MDLTHWVWKGQAPWAICVLDYLYVISNLETLQVVWTLSAKIDKIQVVSIWWNNAWKIYQWVLGNSHIYLLKILVLFNGNTSFRKSPSYGMGHSLFLRIKGKGIRFIVLYPPKCSHDLPPLAGTVHTETISIPRGIFQNNWQHIAHTL